MEVENHHDPMWILAPVEARVWIEKLPSGRLKTYEEHIRPKVRMINFNFGSFWSGIRLKVFGF